MTSLVPRKPYTDEELGKLYPSGLELHQVQILMRHGERTPVTARFQNAGLREFWPYCSSVRQLKSAVLSGTSSPATFDTFEWKRRLETFSPQDDSPVVATGTDGSPDSICDMGSLTDIGRQTTSQLGVRLRSLYVQRLGFLPATLTPNDLNSLYLRSTPIPRALESLQQTFSSLYPPSTRSPGLPPPTILSRGPGEETLYPNDWNCRRFAALSRAFAQRAADRWNTSPDMAYLNTLLQKWMPDGNPVAVDSRPRLSGIMDTINATLAHGPETRLPSEFYDEKAKEIIERIGVEEWFAGYKESREYRMLGIGGLMGDIVGRMVGSVQQRSTNGEPPVRFGLSGCHDTTLVGVLASLGAYNTDRWAPFTSHIAVELFRKAGAPEGSSAEASRKSSWWPSFLGGGRSTAPKPIGRKPTPELTPAEKKALDGYYVRLRYNDEPVVVPGCRTPGNHLEGDESFCTLAAFKAIVDKYTPINWREQCRHDKKQPVLLPAEPEPAGY